MLETEFISKNTTKWQSYELLLQQEFHNPDKLSEIYLELSNDLSFANTHYPNRAVRLYLNNLMQKVYTNINVEVSPFSIKNLFSIYLPKIFYESRYASYFTLLMFIIGVLIGIISTLQDPDFVRLCLGDAYIDMTLRNIANDEPMAVYNQGNATSSFWQIFQNNASISARVFILGILGGVGSLFFLMVNAIMVGSVQTFFIQQGYAKESLMTIWTHGTLEFISIFFACTAGFYIGISLLFPKTYTRLQSLQIAAKKSLALVILSIICLFISALIEAYITPLNLSDLTRLIFIFTPCLIYLAYVFIYPYYLNNKGKFMQQEAEEVSAIEVKKMTLNSLKDIFSSFLLTIQIYGRHIGYFVVLALVFAYLFSILFYNEKGVSEDFFMQNEHALFIGISTSIIALVSYWVCHKVYAEMYKVEGITLASQSIKHIILFSALIVALNFASIYLFYYIEFSFFSLMGGIILYNCMALTYNIGIGKMNIISIDFIASNLVNLVLCALILWFSSYILSSNIWLLISEIIALIIPMSEEMIIFFEYFFKIASYVFIYFIVFPLSYLCLGITHIRFKEMHNATTIFSKIKQIKTKTQYYGMESES